VAGYSALDRVGVRTGPAWLYAWALWTVCALGLVGWRALIARIRATPPGNRPAAYAGAVDPRRSLLAGLLIIGTYMLILLAFQIAPLAGVAPLRESATILAAAWGVIVLGERDRAGVRLAAAAAVGVGAILLAVSG
jgi:drug/metabolite transporter (DMT)-like permease